MGRVIDWTPATAYCYKHGGCCKGCKYMLWTSSTCKAKEAVVKLLEKYGEPPQKLLDYKY